MSISAEVGVYPFLPTEPTEGGVHDPHLFENTSVAHPTEKTKKHSKPRAKRRRADLRQTTTKVIDLVSSDEEGQSRVKKTKPTEQSYPMKPEYHSQPREQYTQRPPPDSDSTITPPYSGEVMSNFNPREYDPRPFMAGPRRVVQREGPFNDPIPWTGPKIPGSDATPLPSSSPSVTDEQYYSGGRSYSVYHGPKLEDGPPPPPRVPIKEPVLCPEQAELVEIILSGRNVFYTGSAGCGKSTVLKAFTSRLRDQGRKVDIVAPTGISALGVGGSTTYVYAGWNLSTLKQPLKKLRAGAHGKYVRQRLKATDVLVIDEISMVENFHFERLNAVMQEARGSYKPFGGVQIVVTGDFHQLPPVKPFSNCLQCGKDLIENRSQSLYTCKEHGVFHDEDKWAFKSEVWGLCDFVYFHLKTIHRQNDETFIKILQKCRIGQSLLGEETELLMNHPCVTTNATKLYARREEVRRENQKRFEKLLSEKYSFPALDDVNLNPDHHLPDRYTYRMPDGSLESLKDHRFEAVAEFKKGMLVVLLTNLDLSQRLCNGSQGIICGYEDFDTKKLPRKPVKNNTTTGKNNPLTIELPPENTIHGDYAELREMYIRKFMDREEIPKRKKVWPIVRFHNGVVRTIYADCSVHPIGNKEPYSLLIRTQIPLAPAWAMSIHKSQSLTLDRVIVDLTRAWEEGQVYVALSRATSLSGLRIEGSPQGLSVGKGGNTEVRKFHMEKFGI